MKNKVTEEDILFVFVEEMETRGEKSKLVRLDIDEKMLEKINKQKGSCLNMQKLHSFADRCLANEWLEHTIMGCGKYGCLSITTKGVGVVKSRQRQEEARTSRSKIKKHRTLLKTTKEYSLRSVLR